MASAEANSGSSAPESKGDAIFKDIFRRADKNDDGKISWEEFVSYFADGVMGKEELQTLFNEIDTHNTNNIDTEELCSYFREHMGEDFRELFGTCQDLNSSTTKALISTKEAYKSADRKGKFMMRFLTREILNQTSAVQSSLEDATGSLDTQARAESADVTPVSPEDIMKKGDGPTITPGRVARRTKRQASNQSVLSDAYSPAMVTQVDRLAGLLDRLESKVNFHHFRDEAVVEGEHQLLMLVQREFHVKQDCIEQFRTALRSYVNGTQGINDGCLNISVVDLRATSSFSIYEVWRTEQDYIHNCDSPATKELVETTAEMLTKPEMVHSLKIPASWWTGNM